MARKARKNTSDSRIKVWYKIISGITCVVCSITMFCTYVPTNVVGEVIEPTTTMVHEEGMELPMSTDENSDLVVRPDYRILKSQTARTSNPAKESSEKPQMKTFTVTTDNGCRIADVFDSPEEGNTIGYIKSGDIVTGVVENNYLKMDCEEDAYIEISQLTLYEPEFISADTLDVYSSNFTYWGSIHSSSGLSREDIKLLLKDTELESCADTFYELEKIYGVNLFFALAVAKLESGWGTSDAGRYSNNLFGIMTSGQSIQWFESKDACIEYWFGLMGGYYFDRNLTSPSTIGEVYCDSEWSPYIVSLMTEISYKMESLKSAT